MTYVLLQVLLAAVPWITWFVIWSRMKLNIRFCPHIAADELCPLSSLQTVICIRCPIPQCCTLVAGDTAKTSNARLNLSLSCRTTSFPGAGRSSIQWDHCSIGPGSKEHWSIVVNHCYYFNYLKECNWVSDLRSYEKLPVVYCLHPHAIRSSKVYFDVS